MADKLTPAEEAELAQLEAQFAQPKSGLTPAEEQELAALEAQYGGPQPPSELALTAVAKLKENIPLSAEEKQAWQEMSAGIQKGTVRVPEEKGVKAFAKGLLSGAATALDYPMGYIRSAGGALSGVGKKEDILRTLIGQAPSGEELLTRGGVEEGAQHQIPIINKTISDRQLKGLGIDVASGLLGTGLLKAASKSGVALADALLAPQQLVEKGIESGGKNLYGSLFGKANRIAEEAGKGKNAVSNVLLKRNVFGTYGSIANQTKEITKNLTAQANALAEEAAKKGVTVNLREALRPALEQAKEFLDPANYDDVINEVESTVSKLQNTIARNAGDIPVTSAQRIGRQLNRAAYEGNAGVEAGKILRTGARGTKESINEAVPGISDINKDLGPLLDVEDALIAQAKTEAARKPLSKLDIWALATKPVAFGAGKVYDWGLVPGVSTTGLLTTKTAPLTAPIVSAAAANATRLPKQDPLQTVLERIQNGRQ